ncbi:MAG: hypothetical protein U9N63_14160, partial [Pseudomonadota bacterium]|nr:hypothetical protein [Pseudomonadota bacterium]
MWEISCPACRKLQAETSLATLCQCSRCQCELNSLQEITNAAAKAYTASQQLLAAGNGNGAQEQARISWELRRQPETAQLAFLASLLSADYENADHWYRLAEKIDKLST